MKSTEPALALALAFSAALHFGLLSLPLTNPKTAGEEIKITARIMAPNFTDRMINRSPEKPRRPYASSPTHSPKTEPSAMPSPAISDRDYLPSSLLDSAPEAIADLPADILSGQASTLYGRITLTLFVGEGGEIDQIATDNTFELPDAVLDEITRHFYQLRFRPGKIRGEATRFKMAVEVIITPGDGTPTETSSNN